MTLFKNGAIKDSCQTILTPWKGVFSHHLENRKWLYSDRQPREVKHSGINKEASTTQIDKIAIMNIPRGCSIQSIDWMLPPTYKESTTKLNRSLASTNPRLVRPNFWCNTEPPQVSKERYERQELLENITRQIGSLEEE